MGGRIVQVEARTPVAGYANPALHIAISTPSVATSETVGLVPISDASATPGNAPAPLKFKKLHAAFTHEEELFRTKWGWAAYDAVRRAAMEFPDQTP